MGIHSGFRSVDEKRDFCHLQFFLRKAVGSLFRYRSQIGEVISFKMIEQEIDLSSARMEILVTQYETHLLSIVEES